MLEESSVREIQEEIGLETSTRSIIRYDTFRHKYKTIHTNVHYLSSDRAAIDPGTVIGRYNKSRKVITWILMDNPKSVFNRKRLRSTDIAGIVVVVADVSDVRKLLDHFF